MNHKAVTEGDHDPYFEYLRLNELFGLLYHPEKSSHPEKMFFQINHLIPELGWKIVNTEIFRAIKRLRRGNFRLTAAGLKKAPDYMKTVLHFLDVFEKHLSVKDFKKLRKEFEEGGAHAGASGAASPGFRDFKDFFPVLVEEFKTALFWTDLS